jgi:hypothetical protein
MTIAKTLRTTGTEIAVSEQRYRGAVRGSIDSSAETVAFRQTVTRVLVLHELKKSGALTYDEFNTLKARLLDL